MDEFEHADNDGNRDKNEILSKSIRSGKRTYFFDLKISKTNELYLTITESKRRYNEENGTFFYEKHKLFLLEEDVDSFYAELTEMRDFIKENTPFTEQKKNKDIDFKFDYE
jgi:hypothetical protein